MEQSDQTEILNRLRLIEEMMVEGRQTTQRWGWMFLVWGIGPLIAMFWEARLPLPALAWPVVVAACIIVNGAVIRARKKRGEARTTMMRSVGAVWASVGITVLLLSLAATLSNALDLRSLSVALFALAAVAHSASSMILRWTIQFVAALAWWGATLAAFLLPATDLHILAAAALLLGNVGFGAWLTHREWSQKDE
jgi:hypothetical protein